MVNIPTITDSQILDENIRVLMRQLRQQMADGNISSKFRIAGDVHYDQVDRARDLLFGGLLAPNPDKRIDSSWVTRFNLAIVQGDQEKAIKILVDKETQMSLSWTKPTTVAVKKYIIYYKNGYTGTEYNGTGLRLLPDSHPVSSPFEVSQTYYKENGEILSLELFGDYDVLREFAVQYVDENNQVGTITPLYRRMTLEWEEPEVADIIKYRINYTINGQAGYDLMLTTTNSKIPANFEINVEDLRDADYPMIDIFSTINNGSYAFHLVAIDKNDTEHPVINFKLNKEKKPCYNEYCELINADNTSLIGDRDKINALLWYFNYVFFLDHRNWWSASRMVVERKNRNTIFPKTMPWFFQPVLKMDWERQPSEDQYITYLKQSVEIPILGLKGDKKVSVGVLDVYQNMIDDYVIVEISGVPGDMSVYVSNSQLSEEYNNINTLPNLATAMQNSQIGRILVDDNNTETPLAWMPFRTYSREKITITRQQENIFIFAYFGTPETTVGAREYTSLDFAPERRIKLERWQQEFDMWLKIHEDLVTTWQSIFLLNPLGLILDVDVLLQDNLNKNTLNVPPVTQPGELPNEVMYQIINILSDDSIVTEDFLIEMSDIYTQLVVNVPPKRSEKRDTSDMTTMLKGREKTLNNEETEDVLDIFRLPYGWDLQRVALVKLNETLFWVDVADFNDIGNPLDEVEMFERRVMVLPKFSTNENS